MLTKRIIILFLFILTTGFSMVSAQENSGFYLYSGNYTNKDDQGIDVYKFDSNSGELSLHQTAKGVNNPSYLTLSADNNFLYAVNETGEFNEKSMGGISAFRVDPENGGLNFINSIHSQGQHPCFINISNNGDFVLVSNYTGKTVASFSVLGNGALGKPVSTIKHEGSGPNKKRQDAPHMHSIRLDKENKFAFAADLGSDKLYRYSFNKEKGQLTHIESGSFVLTPGSGPRHFDFNYDAGVLYVITELNNTIEVFKNDSQEKIQTISTLPVNYDGTSYCADIHLHPTGKFLYASNRGHNSIALFSVNPADGRLKFVTTFSVEGDWPRNFVIDPTGKFLLVANQNSNNISIFAINQNNGKLTFKSSMSTSEKPVCLKFGAAF